jgi:hypothetical protein
VIARNAVSQVLCLPCCKRGCSPRTKSGSHLSMAAEAAIRPSVHFLRDGSPTKFGFLARRVYRVPSPLSPGKLRFCGTFSVLGSQGEPFPRRQRSRSLTALVCTRYEHSRHLSLGEPGLSSTADRKRPRQRLPAFLAITESVPFNLAHAARSVNPNLMANVANC